MYHISNYIVIPVVLVHVCIRYSNALLHDCVTHVSLWRSAVVVFCTSVCFEF